MYLGPVCLKSVLSNKQYNHFLLLSVAVNILVSEKLCYKLNSFANNLLETFVKNSIKLYGKEFLVYNIHSLIHIADDVNRIGPLDTFSTFPFENFLGSIKCMLKKKNQPLQQIVKRVIEGSQLVKENQITEKTSIVKFSTNADLPTLGLKGQNCSKLYFKNITLALNGKDSHVFLEDKNVYEIQNILKLENGNFELIVKKFMKSWDFFSYPCSSKKLSIFKIDKLSIDYYHYSVDKILMKVIVMPYKSYFVSFPLRHDLESE